MVDVDSVAAAKTKAHGDIFEAQRGPLGWRKRYSVDATLMSNVQRDGFVRSRLDFLARLIICSSVKRIAIVSRIRMSCTEAGVNQDDVTSITL